MVPKARQLTKNRWRPQVAVLPSAQNYFGTIEPVVPRSRFVAKRKWEVPLDHHHLRGHNPSQPEV